MNPDSSRFQVGEARPEFRYMIRDMPVSDRPRERLARLGPDALADAELIAILLRTGTKGMSAVQVGQELIKQFRTLDALARASWEEIAKVKGVGQTKAIQLKAAFTLARHLREHTHERQTIITAPADAAELVREEMRLLDRESFRVILLNTKNAWIKTCSVSLGSLNASIVEPREVFKDAITASAAGVILAHNHPSGDPTPSSEDIAITKRLVKAGELLGINVHDHIILGRRTEGRDQDFVSLREIGLL
ncbi:MAG: JAB domain-containing protein [Verrucomicrobia bacterium]|nr:JAB domain-containing protein [Verrucomicrobiota bacterium]